METQQPVYTEQVLSTSSNQDFVTQHQHQQNQQQQQQQQQQFIHSTESSPNVLPVDQPEAFPFPPGNTSSCQYDLRQQQPTQIKLEMMSQLTTPNDGQPLLQQHLLQATTNGLSIQHNPLVTSDISLNSSQPLHQGLQQQQQMMKQEFGQALSGTTAMNNLRQRPPPPPIQLPSHYQHGVGAGHAPMLTPIQTPGLSQGIISPQSQADLANYPSQALDQQQPQQNCIINAAPHIDVPGDTPTITGYADKMDAVAMAHDPTSSMENPNMVSSYRPHQEGDHGQGVQNQSVVSSQGGNQSFENPAFMEVLSRPIQQQDQHQHQQPMQLDLNLSFNQHHHHQDQNSSQPQLAQQQQSMVGHTSSIVIPSQQQQQQQQVNTQNVGSLENALQQQELDRQSAEQHQEAVAAAAQQVMAQQMAHQVAVVQQMAILQGHQQQQQPNQANNDTHQTSSIPQQIMMDPSYHHQHQQHSSQHQQHHVTMTQNQQLQQHATDMMNYPIATSAPMENDLHKLQHSNYPQPPSHQQPSSSFTLSLPIRQHQPETPTPTMYADKDAKRPFTHEQQKQQQHQHHENSSANKKARRHTVSASQSHIHTGNYSTDSTTGQPNEGPRSASTVSHHSVTFSDDQNITLHQYQANSDDSNHSSKSTSKPSLQIALPPPPTPAELGLQDNNNNIKRKTVANVDSQTSTPDLSRKVAEATSSDVSAKEFDGMSRDQLITRLVELEKEKRTSQRTSPTTLSNPELCSPLSATASSTTATTTMTTAFAPNDDDNNDDDDDDQEDEEDDDDDEVDNNSSISNPLSHSSKAQSEDKQQQQQTSGSSNALETDDSTLATTDQLATSKDTSTSEKSMTCGWHHCGQQFDGLPPLIAHLSEIHVGSGKATYSCEWENCPRNQKPFTKRHKMFNHLRTHTGERPFVCTEAGCGKRFSRPDSLTTHIKTHSNVRPFYCTAQGCDKAYYHSRSLKKHERTHQSALGGLQDIPASGYPGHNTLVVPKVLPNGGPLAMVPQPSTVPFGDVISPVAVDFMHGHHSGGDTTSIENMAICLQQQPSSQPMHPSSSNHSMPVDGSAMHQFSAPPSSSSYVQQPQFIHLASNPSNNTYTQQSQPQPQIQLQQQQHQHQQQQQQQQHQQQSSNHQDQTLHTTSTAPGDQLMSQLFDSANPNGYIHRM